MKRIKSLLNKMSSPMRPPAGLGDLRLTKSFMSKVFSLFITTQSAEDSRQRRSGMTALLDVKAFTLVELLVVVLIIGILSAIAIPMYQGAVDKSHWSTMLPASKAIKDAEEAFKMTNGEYSDTMEHLDVQISNADLTFTLSTPNTLADPNVIRVTNSKLDNVRLASYLDDSPKFAGQLHCETKNEGSTPNERGQRLCEKLLNGHYLKTTDDGYTRYLLDQAIDASTCKDAAGSWSTNKTKCYDTAADRCTANGVKYQNGGLCKVTKDMPAGSILEGTVCHASGSLTSCSGLSFADQSVCIGYGNGGGVCQGTFDNSICISSGFYGSCSGSTFSNDSVCYASEGVYVNYGCASATYHDTSCCCGGSSCPNAYRCSDTRCAQVEQQVQTIKAQY